MTNVGEIIPMVNKNMAGVAVATSPIPCACAAVRRASRAITQLYDSVLVPSGLKATQFIVLQAIRYRGSVPQSQLAREHTVSVPALSRRLGTLRRKKLIELVGDPRQPERVYRLTSAGEEAFDRAYPHWQRAQSRLEQVLGGDRLRQLFSLTDDIAQASRAAEQLKTRNAA